MEKKRLVLQRNSTLIPHLFLPSKRTVEIKGISLYLCWKRKKINNNNNNNNKTVKTRDRQISIFPIIVTKRGSITIWSAYKSENSFVRLSLAET